MKLHSDFAILDVKHGRKQLYNRAVKEGDKMRIPVTIKGYITGIWGGDDGVSREFVIEVKELKAKP